MKKLKTLFFIILAVTVLSCKKNHTNTDNPIAATTIDITVTDGSTGTAAAGAAVFLYDSNNAVIGNTPKYTATTDQSGKVKITVTYISQYFVIAGKGSQKNYYSGLLPVGIFKTQTEIQNSPGQTPPAVIGSVKFQDTNGDGVITALDNVVAPSVSVTAKTNNTFNTTIY